MHLLNRIFNHEKMPQMSHDEIRAQAEAITRIDSTVSEMNAIANRAVKRWPVYTMIGTLVAFISGFSIGAYKYDANLVKQPQMLRFETRVFKTDSALNAKIDTNDKKVDAKFANILSVVGALHRR